LTHAVQAARQAAHSLAFEEAAMWFDRAATLPETESDARAALSLDAAANHLCAGDFARARSIYERVTTTSDPLVRLQAAIGMEEANARPGVATTRGADLLSSAIAACGLDQADARYVRALGSMGRALAFAGRTREARAVGHRAIEIARRSTDGSALRHTLKTSLWHGLTPGHGDDPARALRRARPDVRRGGRAGDPVRDVVLPGHRELPGRPAP
jgi:tetratricopeptide (TPR) repeat protein